MPRLLWLMFQVPMSSPQMTRMFGLAAVWAVAGAAPMASEATTASAAVFSEFFMATVSPRQIPSSVSVSTALRDHLANT